MCEISHFSSQLGDTDTAITREMQLPVAICSQRSKVIGMRSARFAPVRLSPTSTGDKFLGRPANRFYASPAVCYQKVDYWRPQASSKRAVSVSSASAMWCSRILFWTFSWWLDRPWRLRSLFVYWATGAFSFTRGEGNAAGAWIRIPGKVTVNLSLPCSIYHNVWLKIYIYIYIYIYI